MRRDSVARLGADGFALAAALVTATLTARGLGPAGKGYYSSVTLLATLFVVAFEVGIGDAMVVLVGLGKATLRRAAQATMRATIYLAAVGTVAFAGVAALLFAPVSSGDVLVFALGGALVAIGVFYSTLVSFLLAIQRVAAVAAASAIGSAVTVAAMALLAAAFELDVQGALAASVCGVAVAAAVTLHKARSAGIPVRPGSPRGYLGEAFRMGLGFQVPSLLTVAAARLDLLLVFKLSGAAAAGRYSVALTVGALVVLIPTAVAYAAFPRISKMDDAQARVFVSRVLRSGMLGALATAAVLAAVAPVALPWVFGEGFRGAVTPTLMLLLAGLPWSAQWLLARSASARGATGMLVASFSVGVAVMLGLDVILIPAHDEAGAAAAAIASSCAGLAVAVAMHLRMRRQPHRPSA